MIKAVIYDMDGVLINSEPLWTEAETFGFAQVGIKLTDKLRNQTRGFREDQVVDYWYERHPWKDKNKKRVLDTIVKKIIELIWEKGQPVEGVYKSIDFFTNKNLKLAIASSSYQSIIDAVITKFQIKDKFLLTYSAEHEEFGKPHPGVYLTTAKKLGVKPSECVCIEDTVNGMKAGKAANMKCIVVPDPFLKGQEDFSNADLILDSLKDITNEVWNKIV